MKRLLHLVCVSLIILSGVSAGNGASASADSSLHRQGQSDSAQGTVSKKDFAPIDVVTSSYPYYDEDYGWYTAWQTSYYFHGKPLLKAGDFQKAIYPLNDSQANHYLETAKSMAKAGSYWIVGGGIVEAAGWTMYTIGMLNMDNSKVLLHDLGISFPLIGGGIGGILWGLITESHVGAERVKAVERYNSVVRSNKHLSILYLPNAKATMLTFAMNI